MWNRNEILWYPLLSNFFLSIILHYQIRYTMRIIIDFYIILHSRVMLIERLRQRIQVLETTFQNIYWICEEGFTI